MELAGYLSVARRWWWTLVVATWVAGLSGYLVASQVPPTYEARTQLLVGPINTDINTLKASGQLVQTYAELVTSQPRLEAVLAELGLPLTAGELRLATRATANDVTRVLTIRVQYSDPKIAADLANTLAGRLMELTSQGTTRPEGELQVIDPAEVPAAPVAPQVRMITFLAALAGLLGGFVLVILVEYLSGTVRTREDLTQLTDVPFLGAVTAPSTTRPGAGLVVEALPASRLAGSIRLVATKIQFGDTPQPFQSLLITGSQPGDGSGAFAANVAAVLAASGRPVVLVDADPDEAEASAVLGLEGRPGLTELLASGHAEAQRFIDRRSPGFAIVPRGGETSGDLLDPDRARQVLAAVAGGHLVIVSGPSLLGTAGALLWARAADGTLLVARREATKREAVSQAVESLRLVGARLVGTVLIEGRARGPRRGRDAARIVSATTPGQHATSAPLDPLAGDNPTVGPESRMMARPGRHDARNA